MIEIRPREDLYHHRRDWIETDWHFSFGEYRDPNNDHFGTLRVLNNDRIDPGGEFPMHSHENMEIITWVIEGRIRHEDSTGTRKTVGENGVQKMSAGTGISHSELNPSEQDSLHLIQLWIEPAQQDIEPGYQDDTFSEEELRNDLVPVASGRSESGNVVSVEQDVRVLVGHPASGTQIDYDIGRGERAYAVVMDGNVVTSGHTMNAGDAARVSDEDTLTFQAETDAKILVIDLN